MKRKFLLKILLAFCGAVLLTYFLEFRYFLNNANEAWNFVEKHSLVFYYSALLMFLIITLIYGLTRKLFSSMSITCAIIMIITYIHINKFTLRGSPLLPEDFQLATEAASLAKFVDVWGIVRLAMAVVLVLVAGILLDVKTSRYFTKKIEGSWWKRHELIPRLALVLLAAGSFVVATDFVRNHNGQRYETIPWLEARFVAWNQVTNYNNNGFLLGFLYNFSSFKLDKPDDYSKSEIQEIAQTYEEKRAESKQPPLSESNYNIVIVLEESFYDPEIIKKYYNYGDVDITPELHKIQEEYPSGQMYSLDYGGGTANMEFEVLTGLSNFWANTVPYTDLIPRLKTMPSIATFAKDSGYQTLAIHPFNGSMYKRNLALPREGIDEFITETEMDFEEHDGNSSYINDRSTYNQVLKELQEREGKQFISVITMQNHAPYSIDNYPSYDFHISNIEDESDRQSAEVYLQTLHYSDKYLGEFVQKLQDFDEPTVVLFYGDHSPGVFSVVHNSEDEAARNLSQLTPYFIYANFELNTEIQKLPTTTPNCLSNTLLNILNVQKTAAYYLLDEVCLEQPILSRAYLGDKTPEKTEALHSYELLNYDLLGGKQYWLKASSLESKKH